LQNKSIGLDKQAVTYKDLGKISYKEAWDYQEDLLQVNVKAKSVLMNNQKMKTDHAAGKLNDEHLSTADLLSTEVADTKNHFLLCEHPPVYQLGKSWDLGNILIS